MWAISLYWCAAQQQTSTLIQQKNSLLHAKFRADFNEGNLLQATGSGQKKAKTKVVQKNTSWPHSEAKGLQCDEQVKKLKNAFNNV